MAAPNHDIPYFPSYFAVGQQVVVNSIEWVWLPDEERRFGERLTMRFVFEHHTPWFRWRDDVRQEFSATVTEVQSFPGIVVAWDEPLASSLQSASPASSLQSASPASSLQIIRYFPYYLAVGDQVVINSIEFVWLPDGGRRFSDRMRMRIVFEHHYPWFGNGGDYDVRHEFSTIVTEVQPFPQSASPASSSQTASSS